MGLWRVQALAKAWAAQLCECVRMCVHVRVLSCVCAHACVHACVCECVRVHACGGLNH